MQKKLLALITPILIVAYSPTAEAAATLDLIQQAEISGTYELLLTKGAIEAINRKTGILMYSQAPKWELVICNTHRKVFAKMPPEKFAGKVSQAVTNFDEEILYNLKWDSLGSGKLLGLPVTYHRIKIKESDFRNVNAKKKRREWVGDCAICDRAGIPISVCHAFQRMYGLPLIDGIPVRLFYVDANGTRNTGLETFSCKRASAPVSYTVPANYRRVVKEMDVFAVPSTNSGLDFFRQ